MFCRHCGKQLPDNAQFCSGCGQKTGVPAQTATKAPVKPAAQQPKTPTPVQQSAPQQPRPAQQIPQQSRPVQQTPPQQAQPTRSYNYQSQAQQGYSQGRPNQGYSQSQQQYSSYTRPAGYGSQQNTYQQSQQNPYQQGYQQNPYQQQGGYKKPKKKKRLVLWILIAVALFAFTSGAFDDFFGNGGEDIQYYYHYGHYNNGGSSGGGGGYSGGGSSTGGSNGPSGIYSTDLPDSSMRGFYTDVKNADDVTVMIYMIGSDLESQSGCATSDLVEIANADLSGNINVVIQTGGTSSWRNDVMSDGKVERWSVDSEGYFNCEESLGRQSMLTSSSLSDFIRWASRNYPADRYIFIFWDHGGGSLYGYGYDEMYPNGSMYLPQLAQGLKDGGVKFDIVGFDACLMATVETAMAVEPYADYLIASEETEPGSGWYYTNWLSDLSDDPSMETVSLGKVIVDDFISHNTRDDTLSVTSLREVPRIYREMCLYLSGARNSVLFKNYNVISSARANSKAYADGEYDLVDIVDFTGRVNLLDNTDLAAAIASAVKYRNNCAIKGSCGLSMYFPYSDLSVYSYARDMFRQIGYGDECTEFFDDFVSIMANGKVQNTRTVGTGSDGVQIQEEETVDLGEYDWYDPTMEYEHETTTFDAADRLEIVLDSHGDYILKLTDEDWDIITSIRVEAMLDDGEGYIYLGSDQYFTLDDYDNLIVNFDNTWVSINGQIVVYYATNTYLRDDDTFVFTGVVPAILNEEAFIEILLKYDDEYPEGYVEGYRLVNTETDTVGRTCLQFNDGDVIDFICKYYKYDGSFDDEYLFGDTLVYSSSKGLTLSYEDVGTDPVLVCYRISDIYMNDWWTEEVLYK